MRFINNFHYTTHDQTHKNTGAHQQLHSTNNKNTYTHLPNPNHLPTTNRRALESTGRRRTPTPKGRGFMLGVRGSLMALPRRPPLMAPRDEVLVITHYRCRGYFALKYRGTFANIVCSTIRDCGVSNSLGGWTERGWRFEDEVWWFFFSPHR